MRIFSILLFCYIYVQAQGLTLVEAIELIKRQNLEVKNSDFSVKSAALSIDVAEAQDYGQLNFIQNISRSNDAGNVFGFKLASREADFGDFGFSDFSLTDPNILNVQPHDLNYPDARNYFQSKLNYTLPLYTGKKIYAYKKMAKEMKRIALLEKEDQINSKIYETRKSYYDMRLLDDSLKKLHIILSNIQTLEKTTKEMIQEGYAKKIDLLEVQSKKANITRIISELKANKQMLFHYLSFLLNQEVQEITLPTAQLLTPVLSSDAIMAENIDIQKASTALKIHEHMLTAEKSRYLPIIGTMAEIQTSDDSFLGNADKHKSYTIGMQLRWNLFNGGSDQASIEKAQVERLKMKTQTELAKQGIKLRIKKLMTSIITAEQKIDSLHTELQLSQEIYRNYEGRYKEHLVSMNDVIIKQTQWLEKVLELLHANNERHNQIFKLERLALYEGDNQ